MPININMPQMGYDMQEGTVVKWTKSAGDEISVGDVIAEIETDKAVVEFESPNKGQISALLVAEGETIEVGKPIATIDDGQTQAVPEPIQTEVSSAQIKKPADDTEPSDLNLSTSNQQPNPSMTTAGFKVSPIAKRLASERGIDLINVVGTGPGGRITKTDILNYSPDNNPSVELEGSTQLTQNTSQPLIEPEPEPEITTAEADSLLDSPSDSNSQTMSRMRQQIARVTTLSKQEKPHFYVSTDIDMTEAMNVRTQINKALEPDGIRVSVNDMIILACVGALKEFPNMNAYFNNENIQLNEQINIGMAIATDEGLIMPAIMDCDSKDLKELAQSSKDLIQRSNSGSLRSQEYTGGTFAVSNLGIFDVTSFVAIIQPPQSAILAVGKVSQRPVVKDNSVAIAQVMTATLAADHRIVDGAEGAKFIQHVKNTLETPMSLVM
ncbi:MAG: 2-oxo acid dehydrogenase subunit E2 [SAR202 cluster bacterium]|nr:2-oxo acid dehydrogenase subunit E2 [SAR202 cluster bacterium]